MNFFHFNKPLLLILSFACSICMQLTPHVVTAQTAEQLLDRDDLVIDESLPWGIKKWPQGKVIELLDLASSVYGRIVIDRYGIDESGAAIKQPFSRIKPGKVVLASIWGSNLDGCYVETVVQVAPKTNIPPQATLPTLLEIAVGDRILELIPREGNPKIISYRYNYLDGENSQRQSIWHMNHRIFDLDSQQASRLINAPIENLKARMHFGDTKSISFEIDANTVQRWQDIFYFNSSCQYVP